MKARVILAVGAVLLAGAFMWQCGDNVTSNDEGADNGGSADNDAAGQGQKDAGKKDAGTSHGDGGRDGGHDAGPGKDGSVGDGGNPPVDGGRDGGPGDDGSVEDSGIPPGDGGHDAGPGEDGSVDDGGCVGWMECVEDLGSGCCGDVAYDPVCDNGVLKCVAGEIPSSQCQGFGPGCVTADGGATDGSVNDVGLSDGGQNDAGPADGGDDGGTPPCTLGDTKDYTCPDGHTTVPWCICNAGPCQPECQLIGTRSEGWYDPCSSPAPLIRYANCANCKSECREIGTKSEGWYDTCDDLLLVNAQCAPSWSCKNTPETQCVAPVPCVVNCDCPNDRPLCQGNYCQAQGTAGCAANDQLCKCGTLCNVNACTAGTVACTTACNCGAGQTCVNEVCKTKSGGCATEPCPCGQTCVSNVCHSGCVTNCDCPVGAPICINGTCGTLSGCGNDSRNCPCGQVCVKNACQAAPATCITSCDCTDPASPVCQNGTCAAQTAKCLADIDCPCGKQCNGSNGCVDIPLPCKTSCDCGAKQVCQNKACSDTVPAHCGTDNDCTCSQVCSVVTGICQPAVPCQRSCDCKQTGQACTNKKCVTPSPGQTCTDDAMCPCADYCRADASCAVGCTDGCNCPPLTAPYCSARGRCTAIPPALCNDGTDCKCGQTCNNGACK